MGGPVEGFTFERIKKTYGFVNSLIPYSEINVSAHGPFQLHAGAYTDDSRMSKIFANSIINKKDVATSKDIAKEYINYYHNAKTEIEKDFIEEYYYKAIYANDKEIFGGQPTNGAIMGIAPFGVISPCNPKKAFNDAFEAMFVSSGYARYATAMAACAISFAMCDNATYTDVEKTMLSVAKSHKQNREGLRWSSSHMYEGVGQKPENLVKKAIEIANMHSDLIEIHKELNDAIIQDFFADASESLAIAIAFLHVSKGDFTKSITGCVNFGRDNDSSASIAGAIAGALNGASCIPQEWIALVESANEGPTFKEIATELCEIIVSKHENDKQVFEKVNSIL